MNIPALWSNEHHDTVAYPRRIRFRTRHGDARHSAFSAKILVASARVAACLANSQQGQNPRLGLRIFLRRRGLVRFNLTVTVPADIDCLSLEALKALVVQLLSKAADQDRLIAELREENARLKGVNGRPRIRPSGMAEASEPKLPSTRGKHRRRGKITPRVAIEDRVIKARVPPGSRFKDYETFVVQDIVLHAEAIRYRYRRERWVTPDGTMVLAPLPAGVNGHFGPELRRFVLSQYHQGQVTVPRLVAQLRGIGVAISKRQMMRLLIAGQGGFLTENRDVLRAGLQTAAWISVDDTGARHAGKSGFCTQIGNDDFAWFGTRTSKSRLNFLDLLRAAFTDYVINEAALDYMRGRALAGPVISQLAAHRQTRFPDQAAWQSHLDRLGISRLKVTPDPVCIATEGALWGSVQANGLLRDMVIVSDDVLRIPAAIPAVADACASARPA